MLAKRLLPHINFTYFYLTRVTYGYNYKTPTHLNIEEKQYCRQRHKLSNNCSVHTLSFENILQVCTYVMHYQRSKSRELCGEPSISSYQSLLHSTNFSQDLLHFLHSPMEKCHSCLFVYLLWNYRWLIRNNISFYYMSGI